MFAHETSGAMENQLGLAVLRGSSLVFLPRHTQQRVERPIDVRPDLQTRPTRRVGCSPDQNVWCARGTTVKPPSLP